MKKILSIVLLVAILLSVFVGCSKDEGSSYNLEAAKKYLDGSYKSDPVDTPTDYKLVSVVLIDNVTYTVTWTTDSSKISVKAEDKLVTIDVPDGSAEEIKYVLTATIADPDGNTITTTFNRRVPASAAAGKNDEEIVNLAYGLADGEVMEGVATLTANIVRLKTPYDKDFGNITIVVAVPGLEDKPIECYRLTGDKVSNDLCVGDTVTVTGTLKNYSGTIEFDAGCTLDNVVSCGVVKPTDSKLIVDEAFALAGGDSLKYFCTLTGLVKSIDTEYSAQYKNICITIEVEGSEGKKDLVCYRLKGAGVENIAVGDTVTITGIIKNYVKDETSTIEFDSGCVLDQLVKGNGTTPPDSDVPVEKPDTEAGIVDAAYALGENQKLPYTATLTGKVTKINDAYNSQYGNITVTIVVDGRSKKPIKCYRLKGTGVEDIAVDDIITVTGELKNYNGTVEFDFGCTLDKRVDGGKDPIKQETDPKKIVDAAYKLKEDADLGYDVTLTGKVTKAEAYNTQYKSVTVTIEVSGRESKPIKCFSLKGDEAANVAIGDTITVTGRLKNYKGTIEFDSGCKLDKRVSGGNEPIKPETDSKQIVDAAFALKDGADLGYDATLTGKIVKLKTPYDKQYKNITVVIEVEGSKGMKEIECFRMKGDKVSNKLCVGDTITVTGRLKNYGGTIEFDANCTLDKLTSCGIKVPTDPKQIVDAAFALEGGESLKYFATLTGKVVKINTAYSADYKNITVTIEVEGTNGTQQLKCYRLKGTGAESIKEGDTITVTGIIKNHVHSSGDNEVEFDAGCTLG